RALYLTETVFRFNQQIHRTSSNPNMFWIYGKKGYVQILENPHCWGSFIDKYPGGTPALDCIEQCGDFTIAHHLSLCFLMHTALLQHVTSTGGSILDQCTYSSNG
ncbi:hypothetical protein CEXT_504241, partial [Caerostris extrusa]